MKRFIPVLLVLVLAVPAADASQRRRTSRTSSASKAAAEKAAADKKAAEEVLAARQRVALQVKTLSQFLYVLGGINKTIEAADRAASRKNATDASRAETQQSKDSVVDSIANVKSGLAKLESDFRSNPNLSKYAVFIDGVSLTAQTAESQAAAGKFDAAGRTLLTVTGSLADALTHMP